MYGSLNASRTKAMGDENVQDWDVVLTARSHATDAVHMGDVDMAFAEVLAAGDDLLIMKLMDRIGPVIDQLSINVGIKVMHAVAKLLEMIENGTENVEISMELIRGLLVDLNEAASTLEPPDDWYGAISAIGTVGISLGY